MQVKKRWQDQAEGGDFLKGHLHFEINLILKKKVKQTQKPEEFKGRLFVFESVLWVQLSKVFFWDYLSKNKCTNPVPL